MLPAMEMIKIRNEVRKEIIADQINVMLKKRNAGYVIIEENMTLEELMEELKHELKIEVRAELELE